MPRSDVEFHLHSLTTDAPAEVLASLTSDTRMSDVFDQWIAEKHAEGQITPQSLTTYLGVLERHPRPAVAALRVREVTPVAVNRVLMALSHAQKFDAATQSGKVTAVMSLADALERVYGNLV